MAETKPRRTEVLMAGTGGRGVLMAGLLLAQAGTSQYQHVSWSPSYAAAMRGGPCECTVMFSDEEILSFLRYRTQTVIVIEPSQLKAMEGRVSPGGLMVVESTGLRDKVEREDVEIFPVPGLQVAIELGDNRVSNLVLLGAYVGKTGVVKPEYVEQELERRFGGRKAVLELNKRAFEQGLRMGAEQRPQEEG